MTDFCRSCAEKEEASGGSSRGPGGTRRQVLVVEDNEEASEVLVRVLEPLGFQVKAAASLAEGLASMNADEPDLVLLDVHLPDGSGLGLLDDVKGCCPWVPMIVMTGAGDLALAAEAMRRGAVDFFLKPLDYEVLERALDRWLPSAVPLPLSSLAVGSTDSPEGDALSTAERHEMVGRHPSLLLAFKQVGIAAASGDTVLIRGETGTGKELVARAIHRHRAPKGTFVPVNCAALPDTLLESELFGHEKGAFLGAEERRRGRLALAEGGTLFLDEIGDTSPLFQTRLLRVLEDRVFTPLGAEAPQPFDTQIIGATHRNLESMLADRAFREDLYYRLRVIEIFLPPLRQRRADIPLIAQHVVARAALQAGKEVPEITAEALARLRTHDWPGNVREMENVLRRAVALQRGRTIGVEDLVLDAAPEPTAKEDRGQGRLDNAVAEADLSVDAVVRRHALQVVDHCQGNKREAARRLGISPGRLYRILDGTDAPP
jgi:DNA-binding NtrC family response regulator